MKNQKLTATLRLVKKQQTPAKHVEDLLQEDDIDVCAVLDAKFQNPTHTWLNYNLFKLGVAFKEQKQKVKFFFKKLFKTNK